MSADAKTPTQEEDMSSRRKHPIEETLARSGGLSMDDLDQILGGVQDANERPAGAFGDADEMPTGIIIHSKGAAGSELGGPDTRPARRAHSKQW
jgi:hypothetical protein